MKKELTLEIEQALRVWMPIELSGLKLNTLRDSIRCSEVTVDNSNTRGGIVDFMRFEEYFTITGEKRLCNLPWRARACFCAKGLASGERRKLCDLKTCKYNYGEDVEENHYLHTALEIKISLEDFKSSHGHNFVGNLNYYVLPKDLLELVKDLIPEGVGIITYTKGILEEYKKSSFVELSLEDQLTCTVCILKASRGDRNKEHNNKVFAYRKKTRRYNK